MSIAFVMAALVAVIAVIAALVVMRDLADEEASRQVRLDYLIERSQAARRKRASRPPK